MARHSPRSITVYGWAFSQGNNGIWLGILPGQQKAYWVAPQGEESLKENNNNGNNNGGILGGTLGGDILED